MTDVYTPCKGDKVVLNVITYKGWKRTVGTIQAVGLDKLTVYFKDYHPEHGWELRTCECWFNDVSVCYPGEGVSNGSNCQEG